LGGCHFTTIEGGLLPPASSTTAVVEVAGQVYYNPPWFVLLPLRALPRGVWEYLLNGRIKETRDIGRRLLLAEEGGGGGREEG